MRKRILDREDREWSRTVAVVETVTPGRRRGVNGSET